ncbi:VOC family protein [Luteococcus sp. H138]|uniref:VOC family protein n=1 Tax=unclassified Luteococcus TaxID=2639923 RepID=UPI00313A9054
MNTSPAPYPRMPGLQYTEHVAFTVPNLDEAVRFFVEVLGAQELYRASRPADASFMPENFDVPADSSMTLAMLRFPPNLNIELFEWSSAARRELAPRHCDAGGHHLCLTVEDVAAAVTVLRTIPGVRLLGDTKTVPSDSPNMAGSNWVYFLTPWGLLMELAERSKTVNLPALVGPAEWSSQAHHPNHHEGA